MSLFDVLLPRPTGRRRRTSADWTAMERRLAELETIHRDDAIARQHADSLIKHLVVQRDTAHRRAEQLAWEQQVATNASWANEHAVRPLRPVDEDTITLARIPAVQPLWQSPMAVAR